MAKKRRKLNKDFERKIYSSKKNVELVLAKIYDIDDEDIQKEYMSAFNKVVYLYDELKEDFSKYNAKIVGISADNEDSHKSFCSEKSINYTLLSDPEGIISNKYGSWIPPFSDRNTFLISPEGEISYRWISVLPINHAKKYLMY